MLGFFRRNISYGKLNQSYVELYCLANTREMMLGGTTEWFKDPFFPGITSFSDENDQLDP